MRFHSTKQRQLAGLIVALAYALCLLIPSVAMALTGDKAHCFSLAEGSSLAHVHHNSDAAAAHGHYQDHGATEDGADAPASSSCCNLFCSTALPGVPYDLPGGPAQFSRVGMIRPAQLCGGQTDLLFRPPILLQSL